MPEYESAEERDVAVDDHLEIDRTALKQLENDLYEALDAEKWGLHQFEGIVDEEQRAVASDLVLSAVEGISVNLREMAISRLDLLTAVGPNGRTMPNRDTTVEEVLESERAHRSMTDFARAVGSTMDCLAAAVIGIAALPASIHRASSADLLALPELSADIPASQQEARSRISGAIIEHSDNPDGWLAWILEFRDAVVHRGHLTATHLPMPPMNIEQFPVVTRRGMASLLRFEPHLRARPWQPDMLSLTGAPAEGENPIWLSEPTATTVEGILKRINELVNRVAVLLREILVGEREGWILPARSWHLGREITRPRTVAAVQFTGFDPDYPVAQPTAIRAHSRSAARLEIAEKVRQRRSERAD